MKHNTAEKWTLPKKKDAPAQELSVAPKSEPFSYARQLRALGQALESHRFSSLDLTLENGVYVAKGTVTVASTVQFSFWTLLRDLFGGAGFGAKAKSGSVEIQARYTLADLEQLEKEGRAHRKESRLMPDAYSFSQILRGAGCYLDDRKNYTLVGITRKGKWLTMYCRSPEGRLEQVKHDLGYLYDYWVKMYLRRGNRSKSLLPDDPTPMVTADGASKGPGK